MFFPVISSILSGGVQGDKPGSDRPESQVVDPTTPRASHEGPLDSPFSSSIGSPVDSPKSGTQAVSQPAPTKAQAASVESHAAPAAAPVNASMPPEPSPTPEQGTPKAPSAVNEPSDEGAKDPKPAEAATLAPTAVSAATVSKSSTTSITTETISHTVASSKKNDVENISEKQGVLVEEYSMLPLVLSVVVLNLGGNSQKLVDFMKSINRRVQHYYIFSLDKNQKVSGYESITINVDSLITLLEDRISINAIIDFSSSITVQTILITGSLQGKQDCVYLNMSTDKPFVETASDLVNKHVSMINEARIKNVAFISEYIYEYIMTLKRLSELALVGLEQTTSNTEIEENVREYQGRLVDFLALSNKLQFVPPLMNTNLDEILRYLALGRDVLYVKNALSKATTRSKVFDIIKGTTAAETFKKLNYDDVEQIKTLITSKGSELMTKIQEKAKSMDIDVVGLTPVLATVHALQKSNYELNKVFNTANFVLHSATNFSAECKRYMLQPSTVFYKRMLDNYYFAYSKAKDEFVRGRIDSMRWNKIDIEDDRLLDYFRLLHVQTDNTPSDTADSKTVWEKDMKIVKHLNASRELLQKMGHEQLSYYIFTDKNGIFWDKLENGELKALKNIQRIIQKIIYIDTLAHLQEEDAPVHIQNRIDLISLHALVKNDAIFPTMLAKLHTKYYNHLLNGLSQFDTLFNKPIELTGSVVSVDPSVRSLSKLPEADEANGGGLKDLMVKKLGKMLSSRSYVYEGEKFQIDKELEQFGFGELTSTVVEVLQNNDVKAKLYDMLSTVSTDMKEQYPTETAENRRRFLFSMFIRLYVFLTLLILKGTTTSSPNNVVINKILEYIKPEPHVKEDIDSRRLLAIQSISIIKGLFTAHQQYAANAQNSKDFKTYVKDMLELLEYVLFASLADFEVGIDNDNKDQQKEAQIVTDIYKEYVSKILEQNEPNEHEKLIDKCAYSSMFLSYVYLKKWNLGGKNIDKSILQPQTIYGFLFGGKLDKITKPHEFSKAPNGLDIVNVMPLMTSNMRLFMMRFSTKSILERVSSVPKTVLDFLSEKGSTHSSDLKKVQANFANYIVPRYFMTSQELDISLQAELEGAPVSSVQTNSSTNSKKASSDASFLKKFGELRNKIVILVGKESTEDLATRVFELIIDDFKTIIKEGDTSYHGIDSSMEDIKIIKAMAATQGKWPSTSTSNIRKYASSFVENLKNYEKMLAEAPILSKYKHIPSMGKENTAFYIIMLSQKPTDCEIATEKGSKLSDVIRTMHETYNEILNIDTKFKMEQLSKGKTLCEYLADVNTQLDKLFVTSEDERSLKNMYFMFEGYDTFDILSKLEIVDEETSKELVRALQQAMKTSNVLTYEPFFKDESENPLYKATAKFMKDIAGSFGRQAQPSLSISISAISTPSGPYPPIAQQTPQSASKEPLPHGQPLSPTDPQSLVPSNGIVDPAANPSGCSPTDMQCLKDLEALGVNNPTKLAELNKRLQTEAAKEEKDPNLHKDPSKAGGSPPNVTEFDRAITQNTFNFSKNFAQAIDLSSFDPNVKALFNNDEVLLIAVNRLQQNGGMALQYPKDPRKVITQSIASIAGADENFKRMYGNNVITVLEDPSVLNVLVESSKDIVRNTGKSIVPLKELNSVTVSIEKGSLISEPYVPTKPKTSPGPIAESVEQNVDAKLLPNGAAIPSPSATSMKGKILNMLPQFASVPKATSCTGPSCMMSMTSASPSAPQDVQYQIKRPTIKDLASSIDITPKLNVQDRAADMTAELRSVQIKGETKREKSTPTSKAIEYLKELENFAKLMHDKNSKWKDEYGTFFGNLRRDLHDRAIKLQGRNGSLLPGEETRLQRQIYMGYKKILLSLQDRATLNYEYTRKFFLKTGRKKMNIIDHYLENGKILLNDEYIKTKYQADARKLSQVQELATVYKTVHKTFYDLLDKIEKENNAYFDFLYQGALDVPLYTTEGKQASKVKSMVGGEAEAEAEGQEADGRAKTVTVNGKDGVLLLEDDQRVEIEKRYEDVQRDIVEKKNKLLSLYKLNYNLMDILIDSQFFVLYVIKAIRILFTYIALFLATRVFSPIYEEVVYDQKKNPPPLSKFLTIFLGFDVAFNTFLVVVLFLLKFLFKTDDNNFVVDKYLFNKYLIDYAISMIVVLFIGFMVAKVMMDKKYFKYKYEGLRAIRAYESVMFNVCIAVYIFPFFLVL